MTVPTPARSREPSRARVCIFSDCCPRRPHRAGESGRRARTGRGSAGRATRRSRPAPAAWTPSPAGHRARQERSHRGRGHPTLRVAVASARSPSHCAPSCRPGVTGRRRGPRPAGHSALRAPPGEPLTFVSCQTAPYPVVLPHGQGVFQTLPTDLAPRTRLLRGDICPDLLRAGEEHLGVHRDARSLPPPRSGNSFLQRLRVLGRAGRPSLHVEEGAIRPHRRRPLGSLDRATAAPFGAAAPLPLPHCLVLQRHSIVCTGQRAVLWSSSSHIGRESGPLTSPPAIGPLVELIISSSSAVAVLAAAGRVGAGGFAL